VPRVKLTASFVREAQCPPERAKLDYFDGDQRGLLLEVRCSGGKTFYQRYRDERGRERQFKLGAADVITLEQARQKAKQILAQAVLGQDPQKRRKELRQIPLLRDFVRDQYLPFAIANKRSWRTDETVLRLHILPALGALPLDQVSPAAITDLIHRLQQKGYSSGTTNRVTVLLRYIFNLARKWNVAGAEANPTVGMALAPDKYRERFLSPEEAERLLQSLETDENQTAAAAIKLLLLTGGRRNEVTQARWEYVDWNKRTLLVPLSKSGQPRRIALNEPALALLHALRQSAQGPYVFPSGVTGRPSPSMFFPWRRIRARAGLSEVRLHDLRHSFASFLVNHGVSLYVVQGLLGHSNAKTTQRYAHLAQQTLLEAAEVAGNVVLSGRRLEPGAAPSPYPAVAEPNVGP
jgi:integrase